MKTMKKKCENLTSFNDLLDSKNGKTGSPARETWEREFETFRIGVMLEQARLERGLTQEQLAQLCGTKKSYISRIENNASDIRLSTLMRIIREGFGGRLNLSVDLG